MRRNIQWVSKMKNEKKPAIRFQGFTEDWEQRKLEEYLVVSNEKNSNDTYNKTDVLSVSGDYGIVNQIEFQGRSFAGASVSNYGVVHTGDIVYTKSPLKSNPYGIIKTNKGEAGIVSTLYAVYHPAENTASDFVQTYFEQNSRMNNYMHPLVNKGAKNDMKVSSENALKGFVVFPNYEEQKAITNLLATVDHLITLHQRKYDKLQNMKKACLEKMFPQNGSNAPEIRFKDFTEPWEQRKLGAIADKVTEKNSGLQYTETFTNSAEFGIISQKDFFDHSISKLESLSGYYIVKVNDFVYNPRISVTAPVGPVNRNKLNRNGVMSPLYTVFRTHNVDHTYLEYYFKSDCWHPFMLFNGDSGARSDRFAIKDSIFMEMPVPYPCIEEQKKIGQVLTSIDHLVAFHQSKLKKLQNIKESLLERMFV